MKKRIILSLLAVFFVIAAQAQTESKKLYDEDINPLDDPIHIYFAEQKRCAAKGRDPQNSPA